MSDEHGVAIQITIDDASIRGALTALQSFPDQLSPALNLIGGAMETKTRLRFLSETDPEGVRWKPSQRALKDGGRTLSKSGHLKNSMSYNLLPGNGGVEWGSHAIYAAIHQFGGTIGAHTHKIYRKVSKSGELGNRFVKKHLSNFMTEHAVGEYNMPRRSFLGIDQQDQEEIAQILANALQKAIDSAGGAPPA